jgi:hypothetical protein
MAEPGDCGTVSMRVSREFSVSRLEKQLLVKVYDILIPVAQGACRLPPHPAEKVRSRHLTDNTSHTKGV